MFCHHFQSISFKQINRLRDQILWDKYFNKYNRPAIDLKQGHTQILYLLFHRIKNQHRKSRLKNQIEKRNTIRRPRKSFGLGLLIVGTNFTMTDVSVWYKNLPIFTKYWLSLTAGISLLARFGILAGEWLYLAPYFVYYKFQFWRLITWWVNIVKLYSHVNHKYRSLNWRHFYFQRVLLPA